MPLFVVGHFELSWIVYSFKDNRAGYLGSTSFPAWSTTGRKERDSAKILQEQRSLQKRGKTLLGARYYPWEKSSFPFLYGGPTCARLLTSGQLRNDGNCGNWNASGSGEFSLKPMNCCHPEALSWYAFMCKDLCCQISALKDWFFWEVLPFVSRGESSQRPPWGHLLASSGTSNWQAWT